MMKISILGWLVFLATSTSAQTLSEAINFPGINLVPSGDAAWFSQSLETIDGDSAIQSGDIADYQKSSIHGIVQGPGLLTFYWKVESQYPDSLRLLVDEIEITQISGLKDWTRYTTYLAEAREYDVEWSYEKNSIASYGRDAAWLDEVSFGNFEISKSWTKTSHEVQSYTVEVTGDGSWATAAKPEWVTVTPAYGTGSGLVTVTVEGNNGTWRRADLSIAGLTHVLDQETALTSADAVNNEQVRLTPVLNGLPMWFTQTEETHDGVDALQSGDIGDSQTTAITAEVQGPGTLSFWWKVESHSPDNFRFMLDGEIQHAIAGTQNWTLQSYELPENRLYQLEWSYAKDSLGSFARDAAWLDEITFGNFEISKSWAKISHEAQSYTVEVTGDGSWSVTEDLGWATASPSTGSGTGTVTVTLEENTEGWRRTDIYIAGMLHVLDQETALTSADAINNEQVRLTPVLNGLPMWFTQTEETHDGVDALQSGDIGDSQTTAITAEVQGPGTLSFWWKVESHSPDNFRFMLDGEIQHAIAGTQNWTLQSYELPENRLYQLEWSYAKDSLGSFARDAAWLDEITFGNFTVSPSRFKASAEASLEPFQVVGEGSWSTTERSEFISLDTDTGVDSSTVWAHIPTNEGNWRYAQIFIAGHPVLIDQEGTLTTHEAADNSSIRLYPVAGSAAWRTQSTGGENDGDTLRSGEISQGQYSSMETWVYGPGEFSFIWRSDSHLVDPLTFFMDETQVALVSGIGRNWEPVTVNLEEPRAYHMRWTYSKGSSFSSGTDSGYVDQIVTPNPDLDWATQYFTSEELQQPEISGPNADPDQDGVPNRIERELGLIPTQSQSTITVSIEALSAGELQIRIQTMSESVSFHLESSSDLSTWSAVVVPVVHFENGSAFITLENGSSSSEFFRLVWD